MGDKLNIKFEKEGRSWYADLPRYIEQGGAKEDCLMVAGVPELLEKLTSKNNIILSVSTKPKDSHLLLVKTKENNGSSIQHDIDRLPRSQRTSNIFQPAH